MNSIPHHLLLSAEIRSLQSHEDKAAHIKKLCVNLPLAKICEELQANIQKSLRRYHALMNGIEFTGIGRPPLVGYKDVGNLHDFIQKQFLKGDSADYTDISGFIDNGYRKKKYDTRTKRKIS